MKAKNIKQHSKTKENQVYFEQEDEWGDIQFVVEGTTYRTKEEAKLAIHKLLTDEFNSRNKEKK